MSEDLPYRFTRQPNRTLLALAAPAMGSLIAEPLAALIDTAFVERLGVHATAGLGAATMVLFSTVWLFNFLNVGTQTEVARAYGSGDRSMAGAWARLAMRMGLICGVGVALVLGVLMDALVAFMSTDVQVQQEARVYLQVRLLGIPGMLVTYAACGALRGLSRMRIPLLVTSLAALTNVALDPLLMFGWGPVPGYGMAGAAAATVVGQYLACTVAVLYIRKELPPATGSSGSPENTPRPGRLLQVGSDMAIRTASLLFFLLMATRTALQGGADMGAAHQAARQVWVFTAFLLDAFAASAHSLVAYFLGARRQAVARRVVVLSLGWSIGVGCVLTTLLLPAGPLVREQLVPPGAYGAFDRIWWLCAIAQPINALSFLTDGIHMGSGEYRYLRNTMLLAVGIGLLGLLVLPNHSELPLLTLVWVVTSAFIGLRALFGLLRIVPGYGPIWGRSPKTLESQGA